jgi:hypothetical protein
MPKTITIAIILFLSVGFGSAQPLNKIKGTVTDQSTKEPISYAGISIEGTFTGAPSDLSGNFEFEVPPTNTGTYLVVSAVGYQTVRIAISEIFKELFKVEMIPTSYEIGNVDVIAGSVEMQRILKNVIAHIDSNYMQGAFNQKLYFKGNAAINKDPRRVDEAIIDYSDSRGYQRESVLDAYQHRNYNFLGIRRNFDVKNLADGMNPIDDLLNLDIVRVKGNILDISYLSNYDLKLDRQGQFEGDSVWVINYRLRKPDLSKTGDFYATSYQGKLTISKSNYAVLKNETLVKASDFNTLGRAFAVAGDRKIVPTSIGYEFSTIYRKAKTGYNLAYLKYNRYHFWKNKTTGEEKTESFVNYLVPLDLNKTDPTPLKGRTYYSEMAFDKKFWDGFELKVE